MEGLYGGVHGGGRAIWMNHNLVNSEDCNNTKHAAGAHPWLWTLHPHDA